MMLFTPLPNHNRKQKQLLTDEFTKFYLFNKFCRFGKDFVDLGRRENTINEKNNNLEN